MKITPELLAEWRTGLHAANPEQAKALVEMLDDAHRYCRDSALDAHVWKAQRDAARGTLNDLRDFALTVTCGCITVRKISRMKVKS